MKQTNLVKPLQTLPLKQILISLVLVTGNEVIFYHDL